MNNRDVFLEKSKRLWYVYVDGKRRFTLSRSLSEQQAWKMAMLLVKEQFNKDVVC